MCKLEVDPFDTSLSTHKLKGKLNGSLACTIDYDYRLIFEFQTNIETLKTEILLSSIGTHNEVYWYFAPKSLTFLLLLKK